MIQKKPGSESERNRQNQETSKFQSPLHKTEKRQSQS